MGAPFSEPIMIDQYDDLETRCPMLGHPLTFRYCRTTSGDTPCRRLLDCWFERIPVREYADEYFSAETLAKLTAPPKPKMLTLLELIEQAKAGQSTPEPRES